MERTESSRMLLQLIHGIFCKKDHPTTCDFYTEIELADCWSLPDIVCWSTVTAIMMQKMDTDEKGLLDSLTRVYRCLEGLNILGKMEKELFKSIVMGADLTVLILAEPASAAIQIPTDSSSDPPSILEVCLKPACLDDPFHIE